MDNSSRKDRDTAFANGDLHSGVEPTIVGGRPLGRSRSLQGIPRGIEVLIKKASVDPEFRTVLLEKRAEAATEIELELSATEAAMLNAIPVAQIEKIIKNAKVPDEHRRVFLGRAAAAMLSVLGLGPGCMRVGGIRPDRPPGPEGPWGPAEPEARAITISGARVPAGNEQIKVSPQDKGPNQVDVVVNYECPFESGVLTLSFQKDDGAAARGIEYRPTTVLVPKGKRETTFQATGRSGDTRWLQVELANSSKDSQAARLSGSSDSSKYGSGEYLVKDCLITHIIEYRKTWKA